MKNKYYIDDIYNKYSSDVESDVIDDSTGKLVNIYDDNQYKNRRKSI
ncbi:hypothetical protein U729_3245 (plasmid) [Clostridium baratii str. Sullivan]|uniref:Uncharacterized protein n=1 Tax=Clostridium baratii str. Sullivan TaxID=1415775 RepID=A0A0A7G0F4_9CLOT|nr:hypothetical protein [Clostridium baratii]AIY85318.1 hypothetical protein U729_3245 [Clostridium baratii str. Sullivan]